jgi:hypothetical protein
MKQALGLLKKKKENKNLGVDSTAKIQQDVQIFAPQDFSPSLEKNYTNPSG